MPRFNDFDLDLQQTEVANKAQAYEYSDNSCYDRSCRRPCQTWEEACRN